MQKSQILLMSLSIFIAAGLGLVLGKQQKSEKMKIQVLRTYNVPEGRSEEIRGGLTHLFNQQTSPETAASAQTIGNTLVVKAPEGFQAGISDLVQSLEKQKNEKQGNVKLDYWVLTGEEGDSNEKTFDQLQSVLGSLSQVSGKKKFKVIEHLSSSAMSNMEMLIEGAEAKLKSQNKIQGDTVRVMVDMQSSFGKIKSIIQMKSGEFVVMGENAMKGSEHGVNSKINIYHILRAQVVP